MNFAQTSNPFQELLDGIERQCEAYAASDYEPTGLQEDNIIVPFGCGDYRIIYNSSPNKIGKTGTGANIISNIAFPNDKKWFDYPLFNKWPYPKDGRIIGTVKNTADDGPIRKELCRWLPMNRVECGKSYKSYYSQYSTDTGVSWDVMTYKQEPGEFEGPLLGWTWTDEPPPSKLIGAIVSRFSKGGIWLITATPWGNNVGAFLDVLDDLREKGAKVYYSPEVDITDNSITDGKPNHLGTKRGLMTNHEIKTYSLSIPPEERAARLKGKSSRRQGKIYMFDHNVHVRKFDLTSDYAKSWFCTCTIDPHPKYYPAIQWWAHTPDGKQICYNEWPTREHMGGNYDELRTSRPCPYDVSKLSEIIKVLDGSQFGLKVMRRFMDPRMGAASEGQYGRKNDSLMQLFAEQGLTFELPVAERIAVQRERIRILMDYDRANPINQFNEPVMFWMPHCTNSIRAVDRHHWEDEDGKEKEGERYKDFIDTKRYELAGLGEHFRYEDPRAKDRPAVLIDPYEEIETFDVSMG